MKKRKDKFFEINYRTIQKMLKSEEVMSIAKSEAEKRGEITEAYVNTQRVWVKGKEN